MFFAYTPHFIGQDFRGENQAQILEYMRKIARNPQAPGLHIEPVRGARDPRVRTGRVTQSRRAVMFVLPNTYIIDAVLGHEDAYRRAERIKLRFDQQTRVPDVIDEGAIEEYEATQPEASPDSQSVLRDITQDRLLELGMAENHASLAVRIVDPSRFEGFCDALPERQGLMLLDLAAGKPFEEVRADYTADQSDGMSAAGDVGTVPPPPDPNWVVFNKEEALKEALTADLKSWRIWLHPAQASIAYHDGWSGPFRVTGGAGTGKTVTALHRTLHLATRPGAESSVLLVTFTTNLAQALKAQLADLAGGGRIPASVEVKSIDALAHAIANQGNALAGWSVVDPSDDRISKLWPGLLSKHPWADPAFVEREWREVVLAQGLTTLEDYFGADRSGMGKSLYRPQRAKYWEVFTAMHQALKQEHLTTHHQVAARALRSVEDDLVAKYDHTVVDEAQDMRVVHWKLLRALTEAGEDDMFIAGDANQRIYGRQLVLSRYGIRTAGRSRRLTVNYRTSAQILQSCLSVAGAAPTDDLDGHTETLGGARSVFQGPVPQLVCTSSVDEENAAIAALVNQWLDDGLKQEEIGVLCPTINSARTLSENLTASGILAKFVEGRQGAGAAVAVMTMHRAKGLEFRAVAVPHLGRHSGFPLDDASFADDPRRRALLYVAISRARERLALFADAGSCEAAKHIFGLTT